MKKKTRIISAMICVILLVTGCKKGSSAAVSEGEKGETKVTEVTQEVQKEADSNSPIVIVTPKLRAQNKAEHEEDFDEKEGIITGTTYKNDYYGFELTMPDDYTVLGETETMQNVYGYADMTDQDVDALKEGMEAYGTGYLFHGLSPITTQGCKENLITQFLIKSYAVGETLSDVLTDVAAGAQSDYNDLDVTMTINDVQETTIDGEKSLYMDISVEVDPESMKSAIGVANAYQRLIVTQTDQIYLIFYLTVQEEEDLAVYDEIFDTFHFIK